MMKVSLVIWDDVHWHWLHCTKPGPENFAWICIDLDDGSNVFDIRIFITMNLAIINNEMWIRKAFRATQWLCVGKVIFRWYWLLLIIQIFRFLIERKFASSCVYWINADIKMSLEKLDTEIEKSEKSIFIFTKKISFYCLELVEKSPLYKDVYSKTIFEADKVKI